MGRPIRTFPKSLVWCNFITSYCSMEPKKEKSKPERLLPDVAYAEKEKTTKTLPPCRLIPPKFQNNLTRAVSDGNMRLIHHLLDKGINVNAVNPQDKTTALHYSAWLGHLPTSTILLAYKANPNLFDMYMRTPLHLAVLEGHYKVVGLLLDNGADCTLKSADGYSAQELAIKYNIMSCLHLMKSSLTLPVLTKATKNHLQKMDTTQRIELWLKDMQLKGLYPRPQSITIRTANIELDVSTTPMLPPLRAAAPTRIQSRAGKNNEKESDTKDKRLVVCSIQKHKKY
ncbi:ankyrin repeat domain-containing protein 2-like [Dysidea avara]|uniref:ankyrin repeat domain-containing protein 2-like n=1 Tax=Dysidea avara TaxID=196820 RepID=UPI00332C0C7C